MALSNFLLNLPCAVQGRRSLPHHLSAAGLALCLTGAWFAGQAVVSPPAIAYPAQANVTLEVLPSESYETLIRRAEAVARAAAQRSFDRDLLINEVSVVILAQNQASVVPILTLSPTRSQWRSRPDPRNWATYYRSAKTLLGFDSRQPTAATPVSTPIVPAGIAAPGSQSPVPTSTPGQTLPNATPAQVAPPSLSSPPQAPTSFPGQSTPSPSPVQATPPSLSSPPTAPATNATPSGTVTSPGQVTPAPAQVAPPSLSSPPTVPTPTTPSGTTVTPGQTTPAPAQVAPPSPSSPPTVPVTPGTSNSTVTPTLSSPSIVPSTTVSPGTTTVQPGRTTPVPPGSTTTQPQVLTPGQLLR